MFRLTLLIVLLTVWIVPFTQAAPQAQEADLGAIKNYSLEQAVPMKEHSAALAAIAARYYSLLEEADFDYEAAWEAHAPELAGLVGAARGEWLAASVLYELNEGIVAGVPLLSHFDAWLDAGPTGEEGGDEAYDWSLELPNGEVWEKPGNIFTHLTEPALWGTQESFVGLYIEGEEDAEWGGFLPEANILFAGLTALDTAATELLASIEAWEPTLEEAYIALVTMLPTMSEYFGQWKESAYVSGEDTEQVSFVAVSRLADILGILNGLNFTYESIRPGVAAEDSELDAQIAEGLEALIGSITAIYEQEQEGTQFTPEEADLFGSAAQSDAEALAALVAQAADLAGIELS